MGGSTASSMMRMPPGAQRPARGKARQHAHGAAHRHGSQGDVSRGDALRGREAKLAIVRPLETMMLSRGCGDPCAVPAPDGLHARQ